MEYYSPEQILEFALKYLAGGPDCPIACASWDAGKQRLTLTVVRESQQPVKKAKQSDAVKTTINRVRTADSATFMEAVRRFFPFAKRVPGRGPRLLNVKAAGVGSTLKYWNDKMNAAYVWCCKRGVTMSREEFKRNWVK